MYDGLKKISNIHLWMPDFLKHCRKCSIAYYREPDYKTLLNVFFTYSKDNPDLFNIFDYTPDEVAKLQTVANIPELVYELVEFVTKDYVYLDSEEYNIYLGLHYSGALKTSEVHIKDDTKFMCENMASIDSNVSHYMNRRLYIKDILKLESYLYMHEKATLETSFAPYWSENAKQICTKLFVGNSTRRINANAYKLEKLEEFKSHVFWINKTDSISSALPTGVKGVHVTANLFNDKKFNDKNLTVTVLVPVKDHNGLRLVPQSINYKYPKEIIYTYDDFRDFVEEKINSALFDLLGVVEVDDSDFDEDAYMRAYSN